MTELEMRNEQSNIIMKPSLLSKFKPPIFFFEVKGAWLYHSYGTPEAELLDQVLEEKDGKIGISFYQRYGIHPSEKELISEPVAAVEAAEKAYINSLDLVAQKTGIPKNEVLNILETDSNSLSLVEEAIAAGLKAKDNSDASAESLLKIQETLADLKKKAKLENKENAKDLEVYLSELNELRKAWNDVKNDYYLSLEAVFLSTARCAANESGNAPNFTLDNIKKLHPSFQTSLFIDFIWKEINGWEEKSPGGSQKSENGEVDEEKKLESQT